MRKPWKQSLPAAIRYPVFCERCEWHHDHIGDVQEDDLTRMIAIAERHSLEKPDCHDQVGATKLRMLSPRPMTALEVAAS